MALNQAAVLKAALELLDEVGLDELTTRRLAARLEVKVGALYWHFASKQTLLDAIADHIIGAAHDERPLEGDWADQVRAIATRHRTAVLAHRDGARLLGTFHRPGPTGLAYYRTLIETLSSAGAPQHTAEAGADTITSYVNGFTLEEQARKLAQPREQRDAAFAAGVDIIVDGISARLQR